MVAISRRGFLQASSSALGAYVLRAREASSAPADAVRESSSSARIYCVFFGIAPSPDDTDLRPTTNDEIVQQLQDLCPGVEFVVRDLTRGVSMQSVINEAGDLQRLGYDGVLIYGWPRDYDLLRTGLPTINVAVVCDFMNTPYPLFKQNRVIDAFLDPWRFCADPDVSEQMFRDLVGQDQTDPNAQTDEVRADSDRDRFAVRQCHLRRHVAEHAGRTTTTGSWERFDETFGTRVTKIGTKEVVEDPDIQKLWQRREPGGQRDRPAVDSRRAEKMINTIEPEVVRSAKVYLAMKMLMEKHDATSMAFHIRTLTANPRPEDLCYPALATSEFQLENVVAKCQSHLNIVLSEMMLQYALRAAQHVGRLCGRHLQQHLHGSALRRAVESVGRRAAGPLHPDRPSGTPRFDGRLDDRVSARRPGFCIRATRPVTMWQIDVQNEGGAAAHRQDRADALAVPQSTATTCTK